MGKILNVFLFNGMTIERQLKPLYFDSESIINNILCILPNDMKINILYLNYDEILAFRITL